MSASEDGCRPASQVSVERAAFVRTGEVPTSVRHEVAESWRRSAALPGDRPADLLLAPTTPGRPRPGLDRLASRLAGLVASQSLPTDGVLFLTDRDGVVLTRWCGTGGPGADVAPRGLLGTASLAEPAVGTTALGLSVRAGAARQVVGAEHLLPALTAWTSTAAPVRDAAGRSWAYLVAFERAASATLTPALLRLVAAVLELEARRTA